jgi:aldehyde dehydrogenase
MSTTMPAIQPGAYGFPVSLKKRYDNYIGGKWTPPAAGEYFDNLTPVTGQVLCQIARSKAADVEKALDAAHAAKGMWGKTSAAERAGEDRPAHRRQLGDAGHD